MKKIIGTLFLALTISFPSWAQSVLDPEAGKSFYHLEPEAQDLPAPGTPLKLPVYSYDSMSLKLKARALIIRDGQLLDVFLPPARVGSNARPEYQIEIPAPETNISYQFFRYNEDGSITKTPQFTIARQCQPRVGYDLEFFNSPNKDTRERILKKSQQAQALETELAIADYNINLLNEIALITED